jgi:hypothetical protein
MILSIESNTCWHHDLVRNHRLNSSRLKKHRHTWIRLKHNEQVARHVFSLSLAHWSWLFFFRFDGTVFVCFETLIDPLVIGIWKGGKRSNVCFLSVNHRIVNGKRVHGPTKSISARTFNLCCKLYFFVLGKFKCFKRIDCSGFCQAHSN